MSYDGSKIPPETSPWFIFATFIVYLAVLFGIAAVNGCASASVRPAVAPEAPFALRVMPPQLLTGQAVRLTCFVPEGWFPGWIALGITDLTQSARRLETLQTSLLVERMACGEWHAFCVVRNASGTHRDTRPILVTGAGCDGMSSATRVK